MLTLTRRIGETIVIGSDIELTVVSVSGGRVRLGIKAPRELSVHRGELISKIAAENQQAVASEIPVQSEGDILLHFASGLIGLPNLKSFRLYDIAEGALCRVLVSSDSPGVQLYVTEATEIWPNYPIEAARIAAGLEDSDVAVAALVTVPLDGGPATANLIAPLVIGVNSRQGAQVILDRPEFGVKHPLVSKPAERVRDTDGPHVG